MYLRSISIYDYQWNLVFLLIHPYLFAEATLTIKLFGRLPTAVWWIDFWQNDMALKSYLKFLTKKSFWWRRFWAAVKLLKFVLCKLELVKMLRKTSRLWEVVVIKERQKRLDIALIFRMLEMCFTITPRTTSWLESFNSLFSITSSHVWCFYSRMPHCQIIWTSVAPLPSVDYLHRSLKSILSNVTRGKVDKK